MIFALQINFSPTNVLSVRFTYFPASSNAIFILFRFFMVTFLPLSLRLNIYCTIIVVPALLHSIDIAPPHANNNSTAVFALDCSRGHHTEGSKMLKTNFVFRGSKWLSKCSCRFLNCSIAACHLREDFFLLFNSRFIDFVRVVLLLVITS